MIKNVQTVTFLIAEDDLDDQLLIKEAFQENHVMNDLNFVEDGVVLLEYLHRQGKFANQTSYPSPDLILLDLNMPRKDGREALEEIKADPRLKHLPVIVLTTSQAEEDILLSYHIGASGFITKPVTFKGLVSVIKGLRQYWVHVVSLPENDVRKE